MVQILDMISRGKEKDGVEVLEKPILVLVGEWECSATGRWEFVLVNNCLSQCVMIHEKMSYADLKRHVEDEFKDVVKGKVGRLSYWAPVDMSVLSYVKTPPVAINSDSGLEAFFHLQAATKCINLLATFVENLQELGGPPGEKTPCNIRGMIRLADGTPSLDSVDLVDSTIPEMGRLEIRGGDTEQRELPGIDLNSIYTAETVAQLEVIEAMAKTNIGGQTRKGKEKVTFDINDAPNGGSPLELDQYGTNLTNEDYDNDFWEELISREYRKTMEDSRLEIGQSSQAIYMISPADTQEPSLFAEETITEVLDEEASMEEQGNGSVEPTSIEEDSELHEAIQLSLENIYQEIIEADIVPSHDCRPCFGVDILPSEDHNNGVYDAANDAIFIGRVFNNKADMQTALAIYAIKRFFNFIQVRSDKNRLIVRCVDMRCAWRVFGHTVGWNTETMEVRTATLTHSCDVTTRADYGKKATCKVIAEVLKSKFANGKLGPRAVDIPDLVLEELRVSITYMKAWHAKEKAVMEARGGSAESYKLLMAYLHFLKQTNPGTICNVRSRRYGRDNCRFKYLFFAFGACIHAIPFMRKVVVIDATTIKAKFRGCLLTASFQDGNFQIMPVGFGVVDCENEPAWTWFFKQLVNIVPDSSDLVFVSDRHTSIYAALRKVYPLASHGACIVHLYRNVKSRFSRNRGLAYLVSQAANAYTVPEFREKFADIERRSPLCANYLRGIGISHWTRVYFQGKRYNIMSSNIAESLNAALAKALEFPIVSMVETIRMMLMRWFNCRRSRAAKHMSQVTPEVEDILLKRLSESANLSVAPASETIFQVSTNTGKSFTVDLQRKTCTCKVFESLGIPCSHALAAARACGASITEQVEEVYKTADWRSSYTGVIMPVPSIADVEVPEVLQNLDISQPESSQGPGRPRKRRIPSTGENSASKRPKHGPNRCSRCLNAGHNRATCRNALP